MPEKLPRWKIIVMAPSAIESLTGEFSRHQGIEIMKIREEVLQRIREYPQHFPLPLEPLHGWRSSPDEGGHTHCENCGRTILRGDPVVGRYLIGRDVVTKADRR
jgi:hypothetical protein